MIRRTKFWKRVLCGLLLFLSLTGISTTVVNAKTTTPKYELSETMITKKEMRGKILLDLPHQDTAQDNGASYGGVTERELAESISLKVKTILEQTENIKHQVKCDALTLMIDLEEQAKECARESIQGIIRMATNKNYTINIRWVS